MRLVGGHVSWRRDGSAPPRVLERVARGLADRDAVWVEQGPVGFLSTLGHDAMESTDQVWVVADLDLINPLELQALTGPVPDRGGLLAALYAREGWRFVRRLRGAFALALWDKRTRELLLAVDQLGVKRLYYMSNGRGTVFASRPGVLTAVPGVQCQIDPTTVYNYLNFGFVPAPASVFRGIARLAPGHLLRVRDGRTTLEPYWDMAYPERAVRRGDGAATLFRLTEEAVGRALGDTPPKEIGAFLSGGTDSSTVVGLTGRLTGERTSAFSIGFREERYNELEYAEIAARHVGAAHYTKIIAPEAALEVLPRLVEAYDEPFGNNSAIGTFFCAQLARECGISLLLAGDGGDEIFGGNERYRTDRIFAAYHRVPAALRRGLLEPVLVNLPDGGESLLGRAQRYVRRANLPNPRRFFSYEFFFVQEASELLTPDFRAAIATDAPYVVAQGHYDRIKATSELNSLLYLDLKLAIGDNDLLKVSRTAELAGVNVRFPLLDLALVEFTGTLPARFKVRGLEKRPLFKRAFRDLLPREILAKRKHGFGVPTSTWIRDHRRFRELARETLLSTRARQRGYFRAGAIEGLFARHQEDTTPFYGDLLWRVLMLELWHRRHLDGATVG